MKHFSLLFSCLLIVLASFGQIASKKNKIEQAGPHLFFVSFDSSSCKSTLVEFEKFLVLIETPASDQGADATVLKDHILQGNRAYKEITRKFPHKSIKYIFCSHWHPHSVSAVASFLEHGATFIVTKNTLDKLNTYNDFNKIPTWKKSVQLLESDSLVIEDKVNKLVAYRLLKKDYPNIPTEDYVHFYLPKQDALHVGCMYNKQVEYMPGGKEFITGREKDLYAFIDKQSWKPKNLIRLAGDTNYQNRMLPYTGLEDVIKNGIELRSIAMPFFQLSTNTLITKQDSILTEIVSNQVPPYIFNQATYQCLKKKQLEQALAFAKLQMMLLPNDPNAWDTLGETYYFLGQKQLAKTYDMVRRRISPNSAGGEDAWEKDWKEHQEIWGNAQIP